MSWHPNGGVPVPRLTAIGPASLWTLRSVLFPWPKRARYGAKADGPVTVRHVHGQVVRIRIVGVAGVEDARERPFLAGRLAVGQDVAVVEALPASAASLQEDQNLFGIPRLGEHRVFGARNADRAVRAETRRVSGVGCVRGVEWVREPARLWGGAATCQLPLARCYVRDDDIVNDNWAGAWFSQCPFPARTTHQSQFFAVRCPGR